MKNKNEILNNINNKECKQDLAYIITNYSIDKILSIGEFDVTGEFDIIKLEREFKILNYEEFKTCIIVENIYDGSTIALYDDITCNIDERMKDIEESLYEAAYVALYNSISIDDNILNKVLEENELSLLIYSYINNDTIHEILEEDHSSNIYEELEKGLDEKILEYVQDLNEIDHFGGMDDMIRVNKHIINYNQETYEAALKLFIEHSEVTFNALLGA